VGVAKIQAGTLQTTINPLTYSSAKDALIIPTSRIISGTLS
jgi:hypothetical protein